MAGKQNEANFSLIIVKVDWISKDIYKQEMENVYEENFSKQ